MDLKLALNRESMMELAFIFVILIAAIFASFGKVIISGVVGFILILAIGAIFHFKGTNSE